RLQDAAQRAVRRRAATRSEREGAEAGAARALLGGPRAARVAQPSITIPPSTTSVCPVIMFESSEARNTAAPVRSSGSRGLRSALNITSDWRMPSGTIFFVASVIVTPGAMALTLIPQGPRAPAMYLVRPATPIFATL